MWVHREVAGGRIVLRSGPALRAYPVGLAGCEAEAAGCSSIVPWLRQVPVGAETAGCALRTPGGRGCRKRTSALSVRSTKPGGLCGTGPTKRPANPGGKSWRGRQSGSGCSPQSQRRGDALRIPFAMQEPPPPRRSHRSKITHRSTEGASRLGVLRGEACKDCAPHRGAKVRPRRTPKRPFAYFSRVGKVGRPGAKPPYPPSRAGSAQKNLSTAPQTPKIFPSSP